MSLCYQDMARMSTRRTLRWIKSLLGQHVTVYTVPIHEDNPYREGEEAPPGDRHPEEQVRGHLPDVAANRQNNPKHNPPGQATKIEKSLFNGSVNPTRQT